MFLPVRVRGDAQPSNPGSSGFAVPVRKLAVVSVLLLLGGPCMGYCAQEGDFSYEQVGTEIMITRYNCADSTVSIPDTIAGKRVTILGDRAFYRVILAQ